MATSITTHDPHAAPPDRPPPSDSPRGALAAGAAIVLVFFGGFGAWALTAPLNSAVVADAVVVVEGNRKGVQHLDGGIVRELRVREGDRVDSGDVLLLLDDTDVRAEVEILSEQESLLRAVEARLEAERDGRDAVVFPSAIEARRGEPTVESTVAGQIDEFNDRRTALQGQASILERRITQTREDIAGNQALRAAYQEQLDSIAAEKASLQDLLAKELITRARMLQLDRTESGIRGQIAEAAAAIAKARQTIAELAGQIAQLDKNRAAEIAGALRDTHAGLLDISPRLQSARAALARTTVRAPYAGTVVDLAVHAVGGVIGRGDRILDIVPDASPKVIEARVAVTDIADVRPGMVAEVHLTAYKQRVTPVIQGRVTEISADRLTDERTGTAYYVASVTVDDTELAERQQIALYPGMPATVMISTEARTAFDYLVGPLTASLDRAFRER